MYDTVEAFILLKEVVALFLKVLLFYPDNRSAVYFAETSVNF